MLKKSITYKDFNNQEVTEDFYFHLYEADIIEMNLGDAGGLGGYLAKITAEEDGVKIYAWLKDIILKSIGHKSPDGRRFINTPEIREDFESSPAFSRLIMEFFKDVNQAAAFIQGIVPEGLEAEVAEINAQLPIEQRLPNREERRHPAAPPPGPRPAVSGIQAETPDTTAVEPIVLSRSQITEMDMGELQAGLASGQYKLQE